MGMNSKKSVLTICVAAAMSQTAFASSFSVSDTRSMSMGGTGVSSARIGHAANFNPALLSTAKESEDFSLVFPQLNISLADDSGFVDSAEDFNDADHINNFEDSVSDITISVDTIKNSYSAINNAINSNNIKGLEAENTKLNDQTSILTGKTATLKIRSDELSVGISELSEKALKAEFGGSVGFAIPSRILGMALSVTTNTSISSIINVEDRDIKRLLNYTDAANAYALKLDDYAQASQDVRVALQDIEDSGGSANASAEKINALTVSSQRLDDAKNEIDTFNYGGSNTASDDGDQEIFINGEINPSAEDITIESTARTIGLSVSEIALSFSSELEIYGEKISFGITPKAQRLDILDYTQSVEDEDGIDNIEDFINSEMGFNFDIGVAKEFGEENQAKVGLIIKNLIGRSIVSVDGLEVKIDPQVRLGSSYSFGTWLNLAADIDVTENAPIAFESPTQYIGVGAELDVFGMAQLRAGYRRNLAASDENVVTAGIGLSPFGVNMDIGVYANLDNVEKEAGLSFETGFSF